MVTRYAMVPALGHVSYEDDRGALLGIKQHSDATSREIDEAVRGLVRQAFDRARGILESNRGLLEEAARALLAQETLDEATLKPLLARLRLPAPVHAVRREVA
jgi:cell division protease FtsH